MKCNICGNECDGKMVIGDLKLKDNSDFVVCNECINQYAHQEYDKLTNKLEKHYKLGDRDGN